MAGVGYAATMALPYDPKPEDIPLWCRLLNEAEQKMQDFVPRLGAWGVRGLDNELVYSMFWPSNRAENTLAGTIMNWMVRRALWIRDRYWKPAKGLAMDGATHG